MNVESFLPVDPTRARRLAVAWGAVAIVSVAAAAWVAASPGHLRDLDDVRRWLLFWNGGARDPYAVPVLSIDYPPNALLVLAPLVWLPESMLRPVVIAGNAVLLAAGVWLLIDWVRRNLSVPITQAQVAALTAIVLCTDMVRSSIWMGQTMPFALILVGLVLQVKARRPVAAAIGLGLLAFKPHVALALGLGLVLTGNIAVPLGGALVAGLLCTASAMAMGHGVVFVLGEYAEGLMRQYAGAAHFRSETNLREVFEIVANVRIANGLQIAVALGGLAWLAAAARAAARDREGRAVLISGALLWGLLSLPFQRFSMLLAIPAWGFVLWSPSIVKSERHRAWLMLGFVLMHVLDLPLLVHALTFALTPDPFRSSWTLAVHRLGEFHSFDALRIAVVALFAVVARTARSQAAARSQVRRPAVT